jgi:hypothetical protein
MVPLKPPINAIAEAGSNSGAIVAGPDLSVSGNALIRYRGPVRRSPFPGFDFLLLALVDQGGFGYPALWPLAWRAWMRRELEGEESQYPLLYSLGTALHASGKSLPESGHEISNQSLKAGQWFASSFNSHQGSQFGCWLWEAVATCSIHLGRTGSYTF